jgi:hypothetical protein
MENTINNGGRLSGGTILYDEILRGTSEKEVKGKLDAGRKLLDAARKHICFSSIK